MRVQRVYLRDATVGDNMEGWVIDRIVEGAGFEPVYGHDPMEPVVVFGGGGMFYDRSHENHWLEKRWIKTVAEADRVAAFSIGVQTPVDPKYYGKILSKCDITTVRDHVSMGRIIGMVGGEIYVSPPLGFLYPFDEHASDKRDIDVGVVINCQQLSRSSPRDLKKKWMQRQVLKHLPEDAVIIPCAEKYEEYDRWNVKGLEILHNPDMKPEIFVQQVSRCRVIICGRYHALITALMTGTPAIVLGKNVYEAQGKLEVLALTAGVKHVYDVPTFVVNMDEIIESIMADWENVSSYMAKVGRIMRRQAMAHAAMVQRWLKSCRKTR